MSQIQCGAIDIDDVLQKDKEMKKQDILKQHPYTITQNKKNGRWYTYIPDPTRPNNRKSVAKTKKEDLIDFLVDFYTKQDESKK